MLTALLVLAIGSGIALVFTDKAIYLRVGLLLALWAAVIASFAALTYRRQSDTDQAKVRDQKLVYDLQLEREISARREYELTVESRLRQQLAGEIEAQAADEIATLRAELAALRTNLEILFNTDLSDRPAIEHDPIRALGPWPGPSRSRCRRRAPPRSPTPSASRSPLSPTSTRMSPPSMRTAGHRSTRSSTSPKTPTMWTRNRRLRHRPIPPLLITGRLNLTSQSRTSSRCPPGRIGARNPNRMWSSLRYPDTNSSSRPPPSPRSSHIGLPDKRIGTPPPTVRIGIRSPRRWHRPNSLLPSRHGTHRRRNGMFRSRPRRRPAPGPRHRRKASGYLPGPPAAIGLPMSLSRRRAPTRQNPRPEDVTPAPRPGIRPPPQPRTRAAGTGPPNPRTRHRRLLSSRTIRRDRVGIGHRTPSRRRSAESAGLPNPRSPKKHVVGVARRTRAVSRSRTCWDASKPILPSPAAAVVAVVRTDPRRYRHRASK
ncbi:putative conserved transmembrane protein rich in alanine, arginine and proline [Mycobacteroides abscessus MAB_082312_2258]|nr:putative conserved transmembrane protein rich in alanine, arginine and proline [Mycobacteroides abscessus MAB_082312_2258]